MVECCERVISESAIEWGLQHNVKVIAVGVLLEAKNNDDQYKNIPQ